MTGELLALAAMLLFATNILVTKLASARVPVSIGFVVGVTVNFAFSALALLVQTATSGEVLAWDVRGVVLFVLAGISATFLGRWFFFEAIARLGAARASLFHVSSPALTVVIAWMFLGEALGWPTIVAIVATMVGLFLVSTPGAALRGGPAPVEAAVTRGRRLGRWIASGFAIGTGATLAYAVSNVLRGAAVRQWNEPVAGVMVGAAAALAMIVIVGPRRNLGRALRTADRGALRLYALGGVLTITAQMCMVASMRHIPVAVATVITLATPIVVLPVSYWAMKNEERIDAATLAGAVLTLAGLGFIVAV